VSLLHVLWGQRTAPQGEQPEQELLHGGAGQLPALLAAELGEGVVRLGEPVRAVVQEQPPAAEHPVQVQTDRANHPCRAVIVAMPPAMAARLRFTPALPPDRVALQDGMAMGACAKVLVVYGRPWWRAQGFSGIAIGDRPTLELVADISDPETDVGVLAAFVVGHRYRRWAQLDGAGRRAAVLADLADYLGPQSLEPLAYTEKDWPAELFIGGAFAAGCQRAGGAAAAPHWGADERVPASVRFMGVRHAA